MNASERALAKRYRDRSLDPYDSVELENMRALVYQLYCGLGARPWPKAEHEYIQRLKNRLSVVHDGYRQLRDAARERER